jgi:hypothetical protein
MTTRQHDKHGVVALFYVGKEYWQKGSYQPLLLNSASATNELLLQLFESSAPERIVSHFLPPFSKTYPSQKVKRQLGTPPVPLS